MVVVFLLFGLFITEFIAPMLSHWGSLRDLNQLLDMFATFFTLALRHRKLLMIRALNPLIDCLIASRCTGGLQIRLDLAYLEETTGFQAY